MNIFYYQGLHVLLFEEGDWLTGFRFTGFGLLDFGFPVPGFSS